MIHTREDWKFGGYTEGEWTSSAFDPTYWSFVKADNTFIFSLNLKKKYPPYNSYASIYCVGNQGPTFGQSKNIAVSNYSLRDKSYCYEFASFKDMDKTNEFNGCKKEFIAKELEVFSVEKL